MAILKEHQIHQQRSGMSLVMSAIRVLVQDVAMRKGLIHHRRKR